MYGEIGAALCRAYTLGFLTGVLHLISMWIDYLGYATMHYCQVMVIGFCGSVEVMMLWMNANDGGPLEQAIHESKLTIATYYMCLVFSIVKCITGFYTYRSFKNEYHNMYGSGQNDGFFNDDDRNQYVDDREQMRQQAQQDEESLPQQNYAPRAAPNDFTNISDVVP